MRSVTLLVALFLAPVAGAQESQVKKAQAALDAFANGDPTSLDAARVAIDRAADHKKTTGKGSVWVLKGHVYTELALRDGVPSPEAVTLAVEAWEGAAERGAGKDAIAEDLARLLSATALIVRDDLESKRINEAWARIDAAMRARALLEGKGWSDPRMEAPLLQFAILTAVRAGKLEEARIWFTDWRAMDAFEPSVAVQVASGIATAEGADAGVAFLEPMLDQSPLDPAMLPRAVEILLEADRGDDAKARIDKAARAKDAGTAGGALLLGKLYLQVSAEAEARKAYERALERNPEAAEAWIPLADLLIAPNKPQKADLERAVSLVEKARDAAGGMPGKATLEAMIRVYGAAGRSAEKAEAEKALQSAQ